AICAIRTNVFHEVGKFDASYKGAGGEDTEFGMRLSQQNYRILSVPAAIGKHLHYFDAIKLIKNDFDKGTCTMSVYLKKGHSFSNHRHAKSSDILAVLLAVNLLITTIVIVLFNKLFNYHVASFLWVIILISYLLVRLELLLVFFKSSAAFLFRAIPLMY
ncbi:galactosyltransferase-related protein, partial [Pediococcus acidilactici]|uniref:galactosyltransferase-related protein n=1 Tax=Pediococcus acidilactici TaxID=1254 RepID=UPI00318516B5